MLGTLAHRDYSLDGQVSHDVLSDGTFRPNRVVLSKAILPDLFEAKAIIETNVAFVGR